MRLLIIGLASLLAAACGGSGGEATAPSTGGSARAGDVVTQDRFVVRKSVRDFDATLSGLLEAIDRRDLTVFAVIDHAAAAQSAGADLPPATLVIFGNPEAGTPLMAAVPVMGAELPLRALVYEQDGEVFLAMTGIANLSRTYPLSPQSDILGKIERSVAEIAGEVTTP